MAKTVSRRVICRRNSGDSAIRNDLRSDVKKTTRTREYSHDHERLLATVTVSLRTTCSMLRQRQPARTSEHEAVDQSRRR